ncbi:unnamed protein product [Pleuronectes platessa]|uniref:Uncharacterized protein n=1 Tax=Pleuronectes platessa TaxID=8262 RepID=A0A9N7U0H3_PLEPL|nr:unnamed protein product [Pleuronectes platessa]
MRAARKALRGASERHGEGVPRWRGRSYLSVSVKTQKHTLAFEAFRKMRAARKALRGASKRHGEGVPRWRGRSYLSVSHMAELLDRKECERGAESDWESQESLVY